MAGAWSLAVGGQLGSHCSSSAKVGWWEVCDACQGGRRVWNDVKYFFFTISINKLRWGAINDSLGAEILYEITCSGKDVTDPAPCCRAGRAAWLPLGGVPPGAGLLQLPQFS